MRIGKNVVYLDKFSVITDALQVRMICRNFNNKVCPGRTNLHIKAPPTKFVGSSTPIFLS